MTQVGNYLVDTLVHVLKDICAIFGPCLIILASKRLLTTYISRNKNYRLTICCNSQQQIQEMRWICRNLSGKCARIYCKVKGERQVTEQYV